MIIHTLVEGYMESLFLPVIFSQIGRSDLQLNIRNAGGGDKFWSIAKRFNKAGAYTSAIGLTDLEQARCAPSLLADRLPDKSPGFHLRLAVRMLESWLLADRQAMAQFLKVPIRLLPTDPDSEQHAKRLLVNIARKSKSRAIRDAVVPDDSGGVVGTDYVATMGKFVEQHWRASTARKNSPSLDKACQRWLNIAAV